MANCEECKHCGYQETAHEPHIARAIRPNGKRCYNFVSTFKHKRGCPVLDCNGNCAATITRAKFELEAAHHRGSVILVITPRATFMYGD
jgi:hypothetical protein